jgi:caa(3)-type oxidase subunit IV
MATINSADRMEHPDAPHGVSVPAPHHAINYLRIFQILVGLTLLTVTVAFLPIHNEMINVVVALVIASTKAAFVARYFMHLKFEGKLIYTILFVPLGLAVILAIALIPDIALGRGTDFNDMVGWFEKLHHGLVGVVSCPLSVVSC